MMKMSNFRGDLTDVSAIKESLVLHMAKLVRLGLLRFSLVRCRASALHLHVCFPYHVRTVVHTTSGTFVPSVCNIINNELS